MSSMENISRILTRRWGKRPPVVVQRQHYRRSVFSISQVRLSVNR
nr:MAG TPA: hypothetical protein [Bacteriophage sp.]